MTPLIVRPLEDTTDEYEIISGHRRFRAAQKAGLAEVPAFIRPVSRDEAAIMVVDSNLHREHLLPSEKAFAYKLKYDALKRQGKRTDLTSSQVGTKLRTDKIIAIECGESRNQIQRYIRLTNLIPELLELMDEGKIAFSVGVELSYLSVNMQYYLLDIIERDDCTPSYSQAFHMHKEMHNGTLTMQYVDKLMATEKGELDVESSKTLIKDLNDQYNEIISWSRLYDSAPIEAKKMIVNSMIKRVDVYRNYDLNIELNMNIRQFFLGMEETENIPITA